MRCSEGYFWQGLVDECKIALQDGEDRGGFVNSYLSARTAAGHGDAPGGGFTDGWMQDKFLAFGAGTALEAGSDTTAMGICTFILYMLNHPEVLKKAQEEVDSVVGADRMPDWDDEPHLPYIVACIKEMLRHRPAAPLGTRAWLGKHFVAYVFCSRNSTLAARGRLLQGILYSAGLCSNWKHLGHQ